MFNWLARRFTQWVADAELLNEEKEYIKEQTRRLKLRNDVAEAWNQRRKLREQSKATFRTVAVWKPEFRSGKTPVRGVLHLQENETHRKIVIDGLTERGGNSGIYRQWESHEVMHFLRTTTDYIEYILPWFEGHRPLGSLKKCLYVTITK